MKEGSLLRLRHGPDNQVFSASSTGLVVQGTKALFNDKYLKPDEPVIFLEERELGDSGMWFCYVFSARVGKVWVDRRVLVEDDP